MKRQYVRSYRAGSLHDALTLVREDLGPDAAVLDTRHVWDGWLKGLLGKRRVEVTATVPFQRPAPKPPANVSSPQPHPVQPTPHSQAPCGADRQVSQLEQGLDQLSRRLSGTDDLMFRLYTELVDAEFVQDQARDLVSQLQASLPVSSCYETASVHLRELVESFIRTGGPLQTDAVRRRTVALVGPTGVGKTTTIAKLAANLRLREKKRVGLITVDTYRIAAVEQLRTYADIIDLPMEVVSTPREMREAIQRMSDVDLILMDTAGRSPRDEIKLQELKLMLAEADADEVHLVMSATAGPSALATTAKHFSGVGATSLLITKLDEATGLGHLCGLLRDCPLPLSYVTHGQNVPDDIQVADAERLCDWMLGQAQLSPYETGGFSAA